MEEQQHYLIECAKDADRDMLAMILIRNGYTVKRTRQKVGSKYVNYIEYWRK